MGLQCLRMFGGHISQGLINMRGVRVPPLLAGAGACLWEIRATIAQRNRHLAGQASTHHHRNLTRADHNTTPLGANSRPAWAIPCALSGALRHLERNYYDEPSSNAHQRLLPSRL